MEVRNVPKKGAVFAFGKYWEPVAGIFVRRVEKRKEPCPFCGAPAIVYTVQRIKWDNVTEEWIQLSDSFEYYCPKCGCILIPWLQPRDSPSTTSKSQLQAGHE